MTTSEPFNIKVWITKTIQSNTILAKALWTFVQAVLGFVLTYGTNLLTGSVIPAEILPGIVALLAALIAVLKNIIAKYLNVPAE